jgi:hypothetical protein
VRALRKGVTTLVTTLVTTPVTTFCHTAAVDRVDAENELRTKGAAVRGFLRIGIGHARREFAGDGSRLLRDRLKHALFDDVID